MDCHEQDDIVQCIVCRYGKVHIPSKSFMVMPIVTPSDHSSPLGTVASLPSGIEGVFDESTRWMQGQRRQKYQARKIDKSILVHLGQRLFCRSDNYHDRFSTCLSVVPPLVGCIPDGLGWADDASCEHSTLAMVSSYVGLHYTRMLVVMSVDDHVCHQGVDHYNKWCGRYPLCGGEIPSESGLSRRLPDKTASGVLSAVSSTTQASG